MCLGRAAVIRDRHSGQTSWRNDFVELKLAVDMLSVESPRLSYARNWRASLLPLLAVVIKALVTIAFLNIAVDGCSVYRLVCC